MEYDRGDSFPFDFEPNEIHLVQNRMENCHHDCIPFNLKANGIPAFPVYRTNESLSEMDRTELDVFYSRWEFSRIGLQWIQRNTFFYFIQ